MQLLVNVPLRNSGAYTEMSLLKRVSDGCTVIESNASMILRICFAINCFLGSRPWGPEHTHLILGGGRKAGALLHMLTRNLMTIISFDKSLVAHGEGMRIIDELRSTAAINPHVEFVLRDTEELTAAQIRGATSGSRFVGSTRSFQLGTVDKLMFESESMEVYWSCHISQVEFEKLISVHGMDPFLAKGWTLITLKRLKQEKTSMTVYLWVRWLGNVIGRLNRSVEIEEWRDSAARGTAVRALRSLTDSIVPEPDGFDGLRRSTRKNGLMPSPAIDTTPKPLKIASSSKKTEEPSPKTLIEAKSSSSKTRVKGPSQEEVRAGKRQPSLSSKGRTPEDVRARRRQPSVSPKGPTQEEKRQQSKISPKGPTREEVRAAKRANKSKYAAADELSTTSEKYDKRPRKEVSDDRGGKRQRQVQEEAPEAENEVSSPGRLQQDSPVPIAQRPPTPSPRNRTGAPLHRESPAQSPQPKQVPAPSEHTRSVLPPQVLPGPPDLPTVPLSETLLLAQLHQQALLLAEKTELLASFQKQNESTHQKSAPLNPRQKAQPPAVPNFPAVPTRTSFEESTTRRLNDMMQTIRDNQNQQLHPRNDLVVLKQMEVIAALQIESRDAALAKKVKREVKAKEARKLAQANSERAVKDKEAATTKKEWKRKHEQKNAASKAQDAELLLRHIQARSRNRLLSSSINMANSFIHSSKSSQTSSLSEVRT